MALTEVLQLLRSLMCGHLRVGRGLHSEGGQPMGACRQKRLMQGAGESAGGVALEAGRICLDDHEPLHEGAIGARRAGEAPCASGQGLEGVALACAGVSEKADGERRLGLIMDGEVRQQVQRWIVRQGGRLRGVGVKQGSGRAGLGCLLEGRHYLVHAFSPGELPRGCFKGARGITAESMPTNRRRKLAG